MLKMISSRTLVSPLYRRFETNDVFFSTLMEIRIDAYIRVHTKNWTLSFYLLVKSVISKKKKRREEKMVENENWGETDAKASKWLLTCRPTTKISQRTRSPLKVKRHSLYILTSTFTTLLYSIRIIYYSYSSYYNTTVNFVFFSYKFTYR